MTASMIKHVAIQYTTSIVRIPGLSKGLTRASTSFDFRQSPFVWFLVLVEQRLNLFLLLAFTDFVCVGNLEELWSHFYQPLGLDGRDVVTVLSRRED